MGLRTVFKILELLNSNVLEHNANYKKESSILWRGILQCHRHWKLGRRQ